jgi:hypothetical protein
MAPSIRNIEVTERQSAELMAAGSAAEGIVAIVGVLASLVGLTTGALYVSASVATVAIGAALVFEGGAVGARFLRSLKDDEEDSLTKGDVWGGMTADLVAGLAGMVMGALALFDVTPGPLIGTAVIVYGAALLLGCAALVHTNDSEGGVPIRPRGGIDTVLVAAGAQLVVGLVALVLGSLTLLRGGSFELSLVALLLVALSELASGAALGSRMVRLLRTTR